MSAAASSTNEIHDRLSALQFASTKVNFSLLTHHFLSSFFPLRRKDETTRAPILHAYSAHLLSPRKAESPLLQRQGVRAILINISVTGELSLYSSQQLSAGVWAETASSNLARRDFGRNGPSTKRRESRQAAWTEWISLL